MTRKCDVHWREIANSLKVPLSNSNLRIQGKEKSELTSNDQYTKVPQYLYLRTEMCSKGNLTTANALVSGTTQPCRNLMPVWSKISAGFWKPGGFVSTRLSSLSTVPNSFTCNAVTGSLTFLDVGKEKGMVSILSLIPSRYFLAINVKFVDRRHVS
jgi:hypothetical protein